MHFRVFFYLNVCRIAILWFKCTTVTNSFILMHVRNQFFDFNVPPPPLPPESFDVNARPRIILGFECTREAKFSMWIHAACTFCGLNARPRPNSLIWINTPDQFFDLVASEALPQPPPPTQSYLSILCFMGCFYDVDVTWRHSPWMSLLETQASIPLTSTLNGKCRLIKETSSVSC